MSRHKASTEPSAYPEAKPNLNGRASNPESLPRFSDKKAKRYDDLTEKEKFVAASISQDTDA